MSLQPSRSASVFKLLDESSLNGKHFKECQINNSDMEDRNDDKYYLDIIQKKKNI
jgi:hypothetical protein